MSNAFVLGLNSAVVRGCGVMKGEIVEEIRVLGFGFWEFLPFSVLVAEKNVLDKKRHCITFVLHALRTGPKIKKHESNLGLVKRLKSGSIGNDQWFGMRFQLFEFPCLCY